uniref:Cyclin C-terminal domain-containing protein n=1 Tax=Cucumis sativus TaxID=3659 RepID=A0A0A0KEU6_CUCSA
MSYDNDTIGNLPDILGNILPELLLFSWLRSSLWLQFKPQQIAAGAAYLSAKLLNMDFAPYQNILQEFQATPAILQDVAQQLMELF